MRNQRSRLLMVLLASCGLAGCGTVVPNIKEAWDSDIPGDPGIPGHPETRTPPVAGAGQIEFEIKKQIFCDLKVAVQTANYYYVQTTKENVVETSTFLPKDWAAQVSLSLEVDESSALNPGVAFNTPMASAISTFGVLNKTPITTSTPQLFSLGVGGTLSSIATRTDKFDPYWTIEELSEPTPPLAQDGVTVPVCYRKNPNSDPFVAAHEVPAKSSPLIESDLGLTEWLIGAQFANRSIPSVTGPEPPTKEQLVAERRVLRDNGFTTHEITQIVASGAFPSTDLDKEKLKKKLLELKEYYTNAEIAKFLASGASPSELLGLKKGGYKMDEITQIVKTKAKASASGGGGSGGGGSGGGGQKPDTLSIEIKFVIVSSGNVTPTWKLVRVSSSTGSTPLFGTGRTRTHDVIITIGPPTQATLNTHLASQIGVSVSNANRALLTTTPSNTFTFPPFAF